jgi:hypothetical protein
MDPQGSPGAWGIGEDRVTAALDAHCEMTTKAWQVGSHETSQLCFYSHHVSLCRKTDELEQLRKDHRLTGSPEERQHIRTQIACVESELSMLTKHTVERMETTPRVTRRRLCEVYWCVGDLP